MSDDRFSIDDNIVLDPKTAKTNNIKKILTGIAILVVLFLIVLIIMKFINSGNMEEPKPLVMPSEETIFKPKAKKPSQPIREIDETSNKNVETKKIEPQIVEIRPIRIEETPKKIENTIETKDEVKQTIAKSSPKEEVKQEPKAETTKSNQEVVVVTSKKETPKQEPKKVIKEEKVKKEAQKQEVKKQTPKAQKQESKNQTSTQKNNVTQTTLQKGNYIQVLATADFKPDADYIKKLKSKGYSYTLYKTTVKGREYVKVLVGPFDEAKLNSEMPNIRATINKDAFVFRVK